MRPSDPGARALARNVGRRGACNGCDEPGRVLVDSYCAECRQLRLPLRAAVEREALGVRPQPLTVCSFCDRKALWRIGDWQACARAEHINEAHARKSQAMTSELRKRMACRRIERAAAKRGHG